MFGRDNTSKIWDRLETDVENLSNKGKIILCGDFNARTGSLTDYITMDSNNNCYTLPESYQFDYINDRMSMDTLIQKNGRRCVNICIENNLCILNGRTLGDLMGKYTCFPNKGCSVVDYYVCSHELKKNVTQMQVQDLTIYSDHCPIKLSISLPLSKYQKKPLKHRYHSEKN